MALTPFVLLALADLWEGSVRPHLEVRWGSVVEADGSTQNETALGGGLLVGYGLDFNWSIVARYLYDSTGVVSAQSGPGQTDEWRQVRHSVLAGAAYAFSDEWTPVLMLEAGLVGRRLTDRQTLRNGFRIRRDEDVSDVVPGIRGTALFEWRFVDFLSVAPGAFVEYAEGFALGGHLWLAFYHYT